jgi:hypothetical protein
VTTGRRLTVIGAGLAGSLLSALLRDQFDVTVIEQGRRSRPLFSEIDCATGEINSSINRAEGLGGTTEYWHNALVEMTEGDLRKAGLATGCLEQYYARAWAFFLSSEERRACQRIGDANRAALEHGEATVAHMVLPRRRANAWQLANDRYPGGPIRVVWGKAVKIVPGEAGRATQIVVDSGAGIVQVEADTVLVCAGGLSTPVLLARSVGLEDGCCHGYHDHPMAYVAKIRLRRDSRLKSVSCTPAGSAEVRAGLVYETDGTKAVIFLRPALTLDLRSIRGPARFILSDLRNSPFSPRKIVQLLANPEALREAILFKTRSGFQGDYYSVLLLGEQTPLRSRGLRVQQGHRPTLDWRVTSEERHAYVAGLERFLDEFSSDIVDVRRVPSEEWEFRTAAHHSGAAARFLRTAPGFELGFFAVDQLPDVYVCDGSLLQAGGIANSGLTLVALAHRLGDLVSASVAAPMVI